MARFPAYRSEEEYNYFQEYRGSFGKDGQGEKALVLAILEQAIDDLKRKTHAVSALRWVERGGPPNFGTFNFCCDMLDLDRAQWRRRILLHAVTAIKPPRRKRK